jgi:uncharacterized protein with beta-barrel porin domain
VSKCCVSKRCGSNRCGSKDLVKACAPASVVACLRSARPLSRLLGRTVQRKKSRSNDAWRMSVLAGAMLVCAQLGFTSGAARAQSIDIPLNLALESGGPMLVINVGIDGQAPRPYFFDMGSQVFVAQYTPSAFGSVPSSQQGLQQGLVETYNDGTSFTYNMVYSPSFTFYQSTTSTSGVTLNAISPSGAQSQFQLGAITPCTGSGCVTFPESGVAGGFGGDYGVFGAAIFTDHGAGGILGQAVVPGTTAGWVVAANGQPLSALNAGANQQYASSPNGPQVGQTVTSCSPCVMLGLTPALIAQFKPVNLIPYTPLYTFANSGAPATSPYPLALTLTVTSPGGSTVTVTSNSSLDNGTPFFYLSGQIPHVDYQNGGTLTISGPLSGATPTSYTLFDNSSPATCCNPYYAYPSTDVSIGRESIIGLGFFLTNSVLYNLAGEAVGYTSNFVTDANMATTPSSPLIIDSSSVPLGLAGIISGGGPLEINTGGSATLSGTNIYTGTTAVNGGYLALVGPGSISTSSGIKVSNGGVFDISGVGDGSPAGALIQSLSSTDNTGFVLLGANQLILTNANGTFAGVIEDGGGYGGVGGSLAIVGGTEILTGTGAYTGATVIDGGVLEVDGLIAGTSGVTVNAGGALSGTGIVDPVTTTIMSGGALMPGNAANPTGALTITGNLAFQSAAFYLVTISGGNASSTYVSGTASLGGTVEAAFASAATARSYDILHTGLGLGGTTFGGAAALDPNYSASLNYTSTDVFLDVAASLGAGTPLNQNQQTIANTINNVFNSGGTLPAGFGNLFNLTGANLGNALAQLDGEDSTGAERGAFNLMNEFLGLILDPFVDGRGGSATGSAALGFAPDREASLPPDLALAYAGLLKAPPQQTFGQRWSAWGTGFGGSATTSGDPTVGSNNVTTSTYGYAAGMDYRYSPGTVLGFSLAGGGTNWTLANALGTGRSDAFLAGLYGVTHHGPWYFGGALAFANNWFTTNRTAMGDQLTASFQGQSYSARLEGGYRFAVPVNRNAIGLTPYAAIQVQDFHTPSYSETDVTGGGFGLSYNAMDGTDTRSELGGRFDDLTALCALPLVLRAKLAWAHDWASNPALNPAFESLPGASFTVNGAPIPQDSALTSAGAQLFFAPNWSVLAKFDGEFASGSQLYAGTGTLRYTW